MVLTIWSYARAVDRADLLAQADELYAYLPGDFTAHRDGRAKELKGTDPTLASAVKKLRRPTVAAWALNLLVRRDAAQIEQILTVAVALREAAATLDGEQMRELTKQRRQLTAALTTRAGQFTAAEGHPLSGSVADQVEATLTAAMLDAGAADAVRSGLLVSALSATGLDPVDLDAALAVAGVQGHLAPTLTGPDPDQPRRPNLRVVPDPDAGLRARRTAQHALAEAERGVVRAKGALQRAQREVDVLEADGLRVQAELEEARRKVASLEDRAEQVDAALAEAEEVRDLVDLDHTEAVEQRDQAKSALDRLS